MTGWWVSDFALGALAMWLLALGLRKWAPNWARKIKLDAGAAVDGPVGLPPEASKGPAAVDPATLPTSTTNEDIKSGRVAQRVEHPELRELLRILSDWHPQEHYYEDQFHDSFERFLRKHGYRQEAYEHEQRIGPSGLPPTTGEPWVRPDFIFKGKVLIEIKRDFDMTATAYCAVGQLTRYIAYWRTKGPSLLLVCSSFSPHLKHVVDEQVKRWKHSDIPVMAHYVRSPAPRDD
jgi:hypothetical protein